MPNGTIGTRYFAFIAIGVVVIFIILRSLQLLFLLSFSLCLSYLSTACFVILSHFFTVLLVSDLFYSFCALLTSNIYITQTNTARAQSRNRRSEKLSIVSYIHSPYLLFKCSARINHYFCRWQFSLPIRPMQFSIFIHRYGKLCICIHLNARNEIYWRYVIRNSNGILYTSPINRSSTFKAHFKGVRQIFDLLLHKIWFGMQWDGCMHLLTRDETIGIIFK